MKAMIFAAGLGTRLGSITRDTPKALLEINGKTILHHVVERVSGFGFNDIIVNVHYFADKVEREIENIQNEGFCVTVSDERKHLLETGGGLYKARWFFNEKPFLLYNVDIITDLNLLNLYKFHMKTNPLVTLSVSDRNDKRVFLINERGLIQGWRNRSTSEEIIRGSTDTRKLKEVAFSGVHVVNPEIFRFMKEGVYSLTSLYLELAPDHRIQTLKEDHCYWTDIGTPGDFESVKRHFEDV
jgi:MurNAc alpha-1-phosphate uridylyltransferase